MKTITIRAGRSTTGADVQEEVLVEELHPEEFRLLRSPGLVLGLAAEDVFRRTPEGKHELVSRGQNVCVQIFVPEKDRAALQTFLTAEVDRLGGRLDGVARGHLVFTIPVKAGFGAIEQALNQGVDHYPAAEWYFGNVYAEDGVTPLNWWHKQ